MKRTSFPPIAGLFLFLTVAIYGAFAEEAPNRVKQEPIGLYRLDQSSHATQAISGEILYPTPYILKNLALDSLISTEHQSIYKTEAVQQDWSEHVPDRTKLSANTKSFFSLDFKQIKNKRVLSIGEGYSGLVPYLKRIGADVRGLDLAYDPKSEGYQNKAIQAYVEKYSGLLDSGDATHLPYADQKFDLVVSHNVLAYIPNDKKKLFLTEAFRVLRPGGEIRISTPVFLLKKIPKEEIIRQTQKQIREALDVKSNRYLLALLHGRTKVDQLKFTGTLVDGLSEDEFEEATGKAPKGELEALQFIQNLTILIRKNAK